MSEAVLKAEIERLQRLVDRRPMGMSVREFAGATGLSTGAIYALIAEEKLKARKLGSRTIILIKDAEEFLEALPELKLPSRAPRKMERLAELHRKRREG